MGVRGASVEVSRSEKLWWEQALGEGGRGTHSFCIIQPSL